ncbi:MAG: hypothetical protein JWM11_6140 [Planctomycetaceae bacterium]|nr:hypothetical protein [Planctomycetaceae bacterium]
MIRNPNSLRNCVLCALVASACGLMRLQADEPAVTPAGSPPQVGAAATPATEPLSVTIDRLISSNLPDYEKLAAPISNDAEFLRRIYLDLTGAPPTSKQAHEFLADTSAVKRGALIDRLLASPEFPRQLARVLDQILMQRRPAQNVGLAEWKAYLHASCAEQKPWNVLASEILSSDGIDATTRPASRFYLDRGGEVNQITRDIGQVFMGVNLECAQCHDHPHVDDWKQRHYYGLSAFLVRSSLFNEGGKQILQEEAQGEVKFESVFEIRDKVSTGPKTTLPRVFEGPVLLEPKFDFGQEYSRAPAKNVRPIPNFSRRQQLADAVTDPNNRQFRRTIANRLWATMMGRGLVHPLEYDHSDNPPSHPALMDLLAENIASRNYDLKGFIRELALTKTYQRSSQRSPDQLAAPMPEPETFAVAPLRPLMAEQMAWSILQATGVSDNYRVNLGANLTEAKFYEQLQGIEQHFVGLFGGEPGKPAKDFETSIEQTLYLSNDPTIQGWLAPAGVNLTQRLLTLPQQDLPAISNELYLSCLTRPPTAEEVQEVTAYLSDRADSRPAAYQELIWALVTSAEFRFNH